MTATTNRRLGWAAAIATAVIVAVLMVLALGVLPSKQAAASSAEVKEAQTTLTVQKLTPEQLEKLTASKYSKVSQVMLESSLSSHDKQRTESTGFSDALTYGFKGSDDASKFAELEEEILRNPVYGVTVVNSIKDKKIGDKRIGDFNPWMDEFVALNDKNGVSYWCEYRGSDTKTIYVTDEYRVYAATLCTWLERLVPQGIHAWPTVENWCLNAAAANNDRKGEPASYQYTKDALILSYVGKNQVGADAGTGLFVIGFNVHDKRPEFYGGTPEQPMPSNPPSVTPDNPDNPNPPTPNPPSPDPPTPDPPVVYDKDPNKAPKENTEPNDDPGPGPSTNNGVGATESTADQPTNSNHMTYEEYQNEVNNLAETNRSQQTGSSSSTPSTQPSAGTKVDNNGDTGTSTSAPINNPTPVAPTATEADTGEKIDATPGEAWGGPSD